MAAVVPPDWSDYAPLFQRLDPLPPTLDRGGGVAMCRVVVLISGSGSNLQALMDASRHPQAPFTVVAVISNRATAFGLQRAAAAGIATAVLSHTDYPSREHYDAALRTLADSYQPDLIALAGFMRILTPALVEHYRGRMVNIHPSLLPNYRGLHTHARALAAGESEAGCTVHFVVPELDAGPTILQARVPIQADDTPETLAARVLIEEHRIYPQAVTWFAEGRLQLRHGVATLDNKPITALF